MKPTVEERLVARLKLVNSGCLEWQGCLDTNGYGTISVNARMRQAHRVSYELFVRVIPKGLEIDHLCRNKRCANPFHLQAVTHRENLFRSPYLARKLKADLANRPLVG